MDLANSYRLMRENSRTAEPFLMSDAPRKELITVSTQAPHTSWVGTINENIFFDESMSTSGKGRHNVLRYAGNYKVTRNYPLVHFGRWSFESCSRIQPMPDIHESSWKHISKGRDKPVWKFV